MFDSSQQLNSSSSLFSSEQSSSQGLLGWFVAAKKSNGLTLGSFLNCFSWLDVYCFWTSFELIVSSPRLVGA